MRKFAKGGEEAEVNMTPMLDIVFIMLIFFIVTAVFVKEAGISVEKPNAENALVQKQVSILVAITEDDTIHVNRNKIDIDEVRTTIEKLHAENPKGSIAIQADDRSKSGLVLEVYDAIKDAGVERIAFSTELGE